MSTNLKIFTENIEATAAEQINEMINTPTFKNETVRIMPDVHAGKGCVVGFTSTYKERLIPNVVGVDIGCGVLCVDLHIKPEDITPNLLEWFDETIHKCVPAGFSIHNQHVAYFDKLNKMNCWQEPLIRNRHDYYQRSIGTLGGGNHFISIECSDTTSYLIIHSGSRHLGVDVCNYYQALIDHEKPRRQKEVIKTLKECGATSQIEAVLANSYFDDLVGENAREYLHDMEICQEYADLNRKTIAQLILGCLSFDSFTSVHNYIDTQNNIIRKGAISAQKGERIIIPLNMRDGSLICVGKGNPDWNCSAPHGAGRIMSRAQAYASLSLDEYKADMADIYSTSVNANTIDESPRVYKSAAEIEELIAPTAEVFAHLTPVYNFKAS